MPITLLILLTITGIFALRGALLGIIGWLTRVFGLISGYILALSYRSNMAEILSVYLRDWPIIVLQVICGIGLFLAGTILVNMFISSIIDFLRATNKALNKKLQYKSTKGRILGAACNAALGAFVVLLGIWGYGVAASFNAVPALPANNSQIQNIANIVGQSSFGFLLESIEKSTSTITVDNNEEDTKTEKKQPNTNAEELLTLEQLQAKSRKGKATIQSIDDPEKTVTIESDALEELNQKFLEEQAANNEIAENPKKNTPLDNKISEQMQELMQNEAMMSAALNQYMSAEQASQASQQFKKMMSDPATKKMIQEQIKSYMNNPGAMQDMLKQQNLNDIIKQQE